MSHIVDDLNKLTNSKERKLFLKEVRKYIDAESKKYPANSFAEVPLPEHLRGQNGLVKVMRSRDYLVQVYIGKENIRFSVNSVRIKDDGQWEEGISWDTLMSIKRHLGYGDYDAVEVYPREMDIVNVANIRHLFILNESLPFIWRHKA